MSRELENDRLRAMLAPTPPYPAPWCVAEMLDSKQIVACSEGHYTAECPTIDAANIIVAAVNAFATGLSRSDVRSMAEDAVKLRQATPGVPSDGPYPASVDDVVTELLVFIVKIDSSYAHGLREKLVTALLRVGP